MSPLAAALDDLAGRVSHLSEMFGPRVDVATLGVLDRSGHLALSPPSTVSPNGTCRMLRAADGWIALNVAREEDRELIPAWLRTDVASDLWTEVAGRVCTRSRAELIADAALLGLPVSGIGEICSNTMTPLLLRLGIAGARVSRQLKVVDLSALWAGPLCGAVLAAMGASVTRIESLRRPDPTRGTMPGFFRALNAAKFELCLDLSQADGKARLRDAVLCSDVVITSARPRAFGGIGLDLGAVFAANPGLVWIAITGYGWSSNRVAFGDDAAAAGGLVRWTEDGVPHFLGDALADPLTGLAAAEGALHALLQGGGVLVDAAMAGCAGGAAHMFGMATAA